MLKANQFEECLIQNTLQISELLIYRNFSLIQSRFFQNYVETSATSDHTLQHYLQ
jgi:hypothetical protein